MEGKVSFSVSTANKRDPQETVGAEYRNKNSQEGLSPPYEVRRHVGSKSDWQEMEKLFLNEVHLLYSLASSVAWDFLIRVLLSNTDSPESPGHEVRVVFGHLPQAESTQPNQKRDFQCLRDKELVSIVNIRCYSILN